jgi:hypothetical protein
VQELMDLTLSSSDTQANFLKLLDANAVCAQCVGMCSATAPKDGILDCLKTCAAPATTVRPFQFKSVSINIVPCPLCTAS